MRMSDCPAQRTVSHTGNDGRAARHRVRVVLIASAKVPMAWTKEATLSQPGRCSNANDIALYKR